MSSDLLTVSNNPLVWQSCASDCIRIEGQAMDVLYKCLDLVGRGYMLYTHPISGNARLLHNPYRTVIMRQGGQGEEQHRDVAVLDYFLRKMESQQGDAPLHTHADYQLVDYDLYLAMRPCGDSG